MARKAINISYDEKAKEYVFRVPYEKGTDPKQFDLSPSGKTRTIATTGGLKDVGCGPDDRVQANFTLSWNVPKADRVGS